MLALLTIFPYVLSSEIGGLGSGENCSFSCCLDSLAAATTPLTCCIWFQLGSAESFHLFSCCTPSVAFPLATCSDASVAYAMEPVARPGLVSVCWLWGRTEVLRQHATAPVALGGTFGLFQSLVTWTLPKAGWWKL